MIPIADRVFVLEGEVGGRPLLLPLLVGEWKSVLIDAGSAADVERLVLPAFKEVGLKPTDLSFLITTHCDFDHQGGNHALKQVCPQALLCCGDADREIIESPQALLERRYDAYRAEHDHFYPPDVQQWILQQSGQPQLVDLTFRGGERLRLGPDWEIEILHLPGHSRGHLGVWDLKNGILFGGDAIHGAGYRDLRGQPALCPTYLQVDAYLATIRFIEQLPLKAYCGCHWPVKRGEEIAAFCAESSAFVELAERRILEALQQPKTLNELCAELFADLGDWPSAIQSELCYAFAGHLENLESRRLIHRVGESRPARYQK